MRAILCLLVFMGGINLGGLTKIGDRNVMSGMSSNLDVEGIIDASVEARSIPIRKIKDQIEIKENFIVNMEDMKSMAEAMRVKANQLRGISEDQLFINKERIDEGYVNLLDQKIATYNSTLDSPGNYVAVTVDNSETQAINSFEIAITQIAESQTWQSLNTFAGLDADITKSARTHVQGSFTEGAFDIIVGSKTTSIALEKGDSLNTIIQKINTSGAGVTASVIQVLEGEYTIILEAKETGTDGSFSIADADNVLNGIFLETPPDAQILTSAQNAEFVLSPTFDSFGNIVSGTYIKRSSNKIGDFATGLTVTLYQETPAGASIKIGVEEDKLSAYNTLLEIIEQYNAFIEFATYNSMRDEDGNLVVEQSINNSSAFREVWTSIISAMSSGMQDMDAEFFTIRDIGINLSDVQTRDEDGNSITYKNKLSVNELKLASVADDSFEDLKKLLTFSAESSEEGFVISSRPSLDTNSIDVAVDIVAQTASIKDNKTGEVFEAEFKQRGNGARIIGKEGTKFYGLEIIYSAPENSTTTDVKTTIDISQGIIDKLYIALDSVLNPKYLAETEDSTPSISIIDLEIKNAKEDIERKKTEIENKQRFIDQYRDTLILKYAQLEQAISSANSVIGYLEAQIDAMNQN